MLRGARKDKATNCIFDYRLNPKDTFSSVIEAKSRSIKRVLLKNVKHDVRFPTFKKNGKMEKVFSKSQKPGIRIRRGIGKLKIYI